MEPMVSVLCAAYNHAKYIRAALDGFLMQECTFPYEIIVHDDASTDGTADIIREYVEKYPGRINAILQTENQHSKGISLRDNLYSKAKGKYTAICEGDDYWTDPLKLQKQIDALEAHPEIDICAACTALEANGRIFGKCAPANGNTVLTTEQVILGGGGFVATCSLVVRSEIMVTTPEFRRIIGMDYTTQIQGSLRGGMLYLSDCMSVYRTFVPGSWTVRHMSDPEKNKAVNDKIRRMLLALDKETDGKYSDAIQYKIKEMRYFDYNNDGKYKEMLSHEMRDVYKKQPLKGKIKLRVKRAFPWFVEYIRKRKLKQVNKQ